MNAPASLAAGCRIRCLPFLVAASALIASCGTSTDPNTVNGVTITPQSVALESIGDTIRLAAVAQTVGGIDLTEPSVSWTSVDPEIATVDGGGLVTAVANGSASIRATVEGVAGNAAVGVAQRAQQAAISAGTDTLASIGETLQLSATARDALDHELAAPTFLWSSSDSDVMTVDESGVVSAVENGNAELVVSIHDVADTLHLVVRQKPFALAVLTHPEESLSTGLERDLSVEIRDALENRIEFADDEVSITVAANPGGGTLAGTTTLPASEGVATFADLSIDEPGAGYTLEASAAGIESATTSPFDVLIHFDRLSAWGSSTCGLDLDGRAYCWGEGSLGRLGTGSDQNRALPTEVAGGLTFSELGAGGATGCALTTDGEAYCWGSNSVGQLGNGGGDDTSAPVPVSGGLTFASIDGGGGTVCGVTPEGAGHCWGNGIAGTLGDGNNDLSDTPVPVAGDHTWSEIRVGGAHACGVTTEGTAYCWGDNGEGQLGIGSNAPSSEPVPVAGGLSFESLALAESHTCGVTTGRDVYCWGEGDLGQLGHGSESGSDVPVLVSGGLEALEVATGGSGGGSPISCALTAEAEIFCWGRGFLGGGGYGTSSVPVAVSADSPFAAVSVGSFHACALASGGKGYCWGGQTSGQLGTGGVSEETPVRVLPPGL